MLINVSLSSVCSFKYKELQSEKPALFDRLCNAFTYNNPDFARNERMGFSTANMEEIILTYFFKGDHIAFGLGSWKKVVNILKSGECEVVVKDNRILLPEVEYPWSKVTLRKDQEDFITDLINAKNGLGLAFTSFGKSLSILEAIRRVKQPATIIVHTEFLAKQWIKEATDPKTFNMPKNLIGGCGGPFLGKERVGQLNICLYHSLSNPEKLKLFVDSCGVVVLDEGQKGAIGAVEKCVRFFKATYRWGVTAQVKRKDQKEFIVYDTFGDVVHEAVETNTDSKILSRINIIETNYKDDMYEWDKQYSDLISRMSMDVDRNTLILRRAYRKVQEGNQVIVFVERKAQAFLLASALKKKGVRVGLLIGKMDQEAVDGLNGLSQRIAENYNDKTAFDYVTKAMLNKEMDLLIATQKGEVGLSIRTLNHAIVTTPVANSIESVKDRLNQIIGRVERTHGEELEAKYGVKPTPTVDILVDKEISSLAKQTKNIKQFYGKRVTVIKRST